MRKTSRVPTPLLYFHSFLLFQKLMAIHCAAIQGRSDGILVIMENDPKNTLKDMLSKETEVRF